MTYCIAFLFTLLLCLHTSCTLVHEFPEPPATQPLYVQLQYDTAWTHYHHPASVTPAPVRTIPLTQGKMRYILRAYPLAQGKPSLMYYAAEAIYEQPIAEGYDRQCRMDLPAGEYQLLVWSDLTHTDDYLFYNYADFAALTLQGAYQGNTDYRDAFRGTRDVTIISDMVARQPDTVQITMQRPLAKFELITTDLEEFAEKELRRIADKTGSASDADAADTETSDKTHTSASSQLNLADYNVQLRYTGYMPNTYNLFTDATAGAAVGVQFASFLVRLSDKEASMGFDYVLVNSGDASVEVQVLLFDKDNQPLAASEPLYIPLQRSQYTHFYGAFLTAHGTGGITIDPSYDDDINIILP